MEVAVTGPLQQTKRHTSNAAEPETMEDVKHGSLQASKRKNDCVLENKTTKKPKMGASTTPPVQGLQSNTNTVSQARTTGFFARNQKPGHTAAMPSVSTFSTAEHCRVLPADPYIECQACARDGERTDSGAAKATGEERTISNSEGGRSGGFAEEEIKRRCYGDGNTKEDKGMPPLSRLIV